jgi:hypothetical protein
MGLLKQLFGGRSSKKDPDREMSRLAAEIRLYNQDALESVSGAPQLPG